jgi:hypothetical protein
MKALIIVESMFGNTRAIADRIADILQARMTVQLLDVADAPVTVSEDVTLLVVGGPTHALGLTRSSTRADAAKRGAAHPSTRGVRDWLETPPSLPSGTWVATFDTRAAKPRLPGSAARAMMRRLRRLGGQTLTKPMSFYVLDIDGPLRDREDERADGWARQLLTALDQNGVVADSDGRDR